VLPRNMKLPSRNRLLALNRLGFVALSPSRGPGLDAQISRWCWTLLAPEALESFVEPFCGLCVEVS
jgi:hypothetical protein